jgi:hypothetical protein
MEFKMKTPLVEKLEERGDPISLMAAREIKSLRLALMNLSGADHLSVPLRNFIEEALGWSEKQDALERAIVRGGADERARGAVRLDEALAREPRVCRAVASVMIWERDDTGASIFSSSAGLPNWRGGSGVRHQLRERARLVRKGDEAKGEGSDG